VIFPEENLLDEITRSQDRPITRFFLKEP